ncbi:hypothetical protein Trydic_g15341 [Trypoxylus dichotomus]
MHRAGISKAIDKLVHSFLRKRTFQVKLEGRRSTTRTATAGVPLGSAISPLLFHIYTSDIPATQRQSDRPTSPGSARHFAGLVRKVENRRPSPEKHGRAFRDRRSPKKEVRQRAGSHLPRRHHS